ARPRIRRLSPPSPEQQPMHGGNIPAGSHPYPAPHQLPRSLLRPNHPPRPNFLIGHPNIRDRPAPLTRINGNDNRPVAPNEEPDEIPPLHPSLTQPANEGAHPAI